MWRAKSAEEQSGKGSLEWQEMSSLPASPGATAQENITQNH